MDRLTDIQGITIAAQNRLCRAGITSCRQLAEASSQEVREVLGYLAQGYDVEDWITRAQALVRERAF